MCARLSFVLTPSQIRARLNNVTVVPDGTQLRFNVAPGTDVAAVLNTTPDELQFVRWGLIPSWAKKDKMKIKPINARSETIAEKPMFENLVRSRRCLILADSFYEWKHVNSKKIPYRIMLKDESPIVFAGLWDSWIDVAKQSEEKELKTCLIVTTEANEVVAPIHERMPVILPPGNDGAWLEGVPLDDLGAILRPFDAGLMKAYEISTSVNSVRNDFPGIHAPVKHQGRLL